jgi:tetratricopeptide (TPR) repeat protein
MFEACFGFGFSELRDRLSDYLPKAVARSQRFSPRGLARLPEIDPQPATEGEIARVRGEWERLALEYVHRRLPQAREPYLALARRTLRRGYDAGVRDPRLLATMGLCEADAGNSPKAREYLEQAFALGTSRPRACYELARLRWAEVRKDQPEPKRFSYTELAPVIQALQRALKQAPPLPEVFTLLAEVYARAGFPLQDMEFKELASGARAFPRRAAVTVPIARLMAEHGHRVEASAVLDACAEDFIEPPLQADIARLRTELNATRASANATP